MNKDGLYKFQDGYGADFSGPLLDAIMVEYLDARRVLRGLAEASSRDWELMASCRNTIAAAECAMAALFQTRVRSREHPEPN